MDDPQADRLREDAHELADDQAPGAGSGDRERDADDAFRQAAGELWPEQLAKLQRATQAVLMGLAECGEQELQGQHTEERHDGLARTDLAEQRRREPRADEEHRGAQHPDPERGRGDAWIVGVGAVDQRRAETEVGDVLEVVDDRERERDDPEVGWDEQPREHERRGEDQDLAAGIRRRGPQEAREGPSSEVTHPASPASGRRDGAPCGRRP